MRSALRFAVLATFMLSATFARAAILTYSLGPLYATNGDVIDGSITIQNDTIITSFSWEVLRNNQIFAGAATSRGPTIHNDGIEISGTSLLLPVTNSGIDYSTPFGSPISPPTDYFSIFPYSNGSGDSKYGLEIEAASGQYPFYQGNGGTWYVDTSATPPTQPYLIGTFLSAPEPSSVVLLVVGLGFLFWGRRRMWPQSR